MTPKDILPDTILEDIERYRSYHWKPGMIAELLYRRHGLRIPQCCLKALADGRPCPGNCIETCRAGRAAPPVPSLPLPEPQVDLDSIPPLSEYLKQKRPVAPGQK